MVKQQTAQLEDLARQGYYPRLKLADAQRQLHASQQEEARSLAEIARLQEATREANAALAHQAPRPAATGRPNCWRPSARATNSPPAPPRWNCRSSKPASWRR